MKNSREHFLHGFLYPESIAIVGASTNPLSVNHVLMTNLLGVGFKGRVYPVNPKAQEILGLKAYPNVKSIEDTVDLVVVSVPYKNTITILKDCIKKGIKRVVITAGGFSEAGEEGKRIQMEMANILNTNGIRAIGPNALSPINTSTNLAIGFHPIQGLKKGGLSLIFQSGLYEPRMNRMFSDLNLRLNKLIDLGNKMDINEVDALSYLAGDPETRVIGIHLESIEGDGREFLRLIQEASMNKHVVVLKSGRTKTGARVASSHTGVIVQGSDLVFDAALRQSGAIRANTIEDFFDLSRALERFGSILMRGKRIALAAFPGGEAVISIDLCQQAGLSVAQVEEGTQRRLSTVFPPWEVLSNPLDLGICTQFHDIRKVLRIFIESMIEDPNVDAMALEVIEIAVHHEVLKDFHLAVDAGKPIVMWVPEVRAGTSEALEWLENQQVPVFPSAPNAMKALSALYRSSKFKLRA